MPIEAKIEDIRIDVDYDGSLSLQCDYREGGEPFPSPVCHWGSRECSDSVALATFANVEAWQHDHYVRVWDARRQAYSSREFEK